MRVLTFLVTLFAFASMSYAQGTHPSPGHGAAGNPAQSSTDNSNVAQPKSKSKSTATIPHYHFSGTHPSPGHGAAGNPKQ